MTLHDCRHVGDRMFKFSRSSRYCRSRVIGTNTLPAKPTVHEIWLCNYRKYKGKSNEIHSLRIFFRKLSGNNPVGLPSIDDEDDGTMRVGVLGLGT